MEMNGNVERATNRARAIVTHFQDGLDEAQIAKTLGISQSLVYLRLREAGLIDARRRLATSYVSLQIEKQTIEKLGLEARKRGILLQTLINQLLNTIAQDNMVKAVLDDDA